MVIFHSYVSLPEGNLGFAKTDRFSPLLGHLGLGICFQPPKTSPNVWGQAVPNKPFSMQNSGTKDQEISKWPVWLIWLFRKGLGESQRTSQHPSILTAFSLLLCLEPGAYSPQWVKKNVFLSFHSFQQLGLIGVDSSNIWYFDIWWITLNYNTLNMTSLESWFARGTIRT